MNSAIIYYSTIGDALYLAQAFEKTSLYDVYKINDGSIALPDDLDSLGIVTEINSPGLTPEMKKFFNFLKNRDNSALKYIYAITTQRGKESFDGRIIEKEFEDAGLNLSYYNVIFFPTLNSSLAETVYSKTDVDKSLLVIKDERDDRIREVVKETEEELIKLPQASFVYRFKKKIGERKNTPSSPRDGLKVEEECTGCGVCYHICPVGNIKMENGRAEIKNECISCFSCYKLCTHDAIHLDRRMAKVTPLVPVSELHRR